MIAAIACRNKGESGGSDGITHIMYLASFFFPKKLPWPDGRHVHLIHWSPIYAFILIGLIKDDPNTDPPIIENDGCSLFGCCCCRFFVMLVLV